MTAPLLKESGYAAMLKYGGWSAGSSGNPASDPFAIL